MKKAVLLCWILFPGIVAKAQTGLHFQFHKTSANNTMMQRYHKDTILTLCKVGTVSGGNNAIALANPNDNTWTYFSSPITPSVSPTMLMKNRRQGIIYSLSAGSYTTGDGWQTSTPLASLTYTPYSANSFGYNSYSGSAPYNIHFSADGVTWSTVTTMTTAPNFVKGKTKLFLYDNDRMYVSSNGGAAYTTVNFSGPQGAGKLYAADDDSLFIIGGSNFKISVNGGSTWTSGTLPSTLQVAAAACKNGKELMIRTVNSQLTQYFYYYSANSGATWNQLSVATNFASNQELTASSECFILFPGYKSYDGGATWPQLYPMEVNGAYDVSFTGNKGLMGMGNGRVLVSSNRGGTFNVEQATAFTSENIMAVKVLPNKFLAADRKSNVWESTNGGQSWSKKYSNTTNLVPVKFTYSQNTNTIVCVRAGQPLISTDGGANYAIVTVGGGQHSQAQKPIAGDVIDVGGLYPSPNFTLSAWEFNKIDPVSGNKSLLSSITTPSIGTESILDLHMASDQVGYFLTNNTAGNITTVYKTTNAWQTVTPVATIPRFYSIGRLQTYGTDTVMVSGPSSAISNTATYYHVSLNGGGSWQEVNTDFSVPNNLLGNKVYKMHFFKSNEFIALISDGYAGPTGACDGVYLQTQPVAGGTVVPSGIQQLQAAGDAVVLLYPNPASELVNLKSSTAFDHVELYDLNGRLVKQLDLVATEQAQLTGAELGNGIYFVKIFSEKSLLGQGKLVIVK